MDKELLGGSVVTKSYLEKVLQDYFQTETKLTNCRATVISQALGVTSQVIRVHLEWATHDRGKHLPGTVIVKCPMAECMEKALENFEGAELVKKDMSAEAFVKLIHKTECDAYKILGSINPPTVPIPLIYAIRESDPEVIVMEDLEDRAGIIANIATGLTYGQWRSTAIHLARLHAWSLTTHVPWKNVLPGPEVVLNMFKTFESTSQAGLKTTIDKYGDYFGPIDESLFKKDVNYESLVGYYEAYQRIMPDVMIHGDTWINNIMFFKDAEKPGQLSDQVAAFLDWQVSAAGCGLSDLAKLTAWCVSSDLRRAHADEILRVYFDEFSSKAAGCISNPKFTFENVRKIFAHILAFNLLLAVPMVDYALIFMAKVQEDATGKRKELLLKRFKAAHDDSAAYFRSSDAKLIFEL